MKATFPVRDFPWLTHAAPVLFVAIAAITTAEVYDSLPQMLATTFDFQNKPVGYMPKDVYVSVVLGYMVLMTLVFAALDRFLVYPVLPVPLMSAISGAMQLFVLIVHLLILDVGILPELSVPGTLILLFALPCAYLAAHMIVFRSDADVLRWGMPLWSDTPPQSWLTRVFFFVRPILPSEVIALEEGLVLRAATYRFLIPWRQIRSLEHATTSEAISATAVRLSSSPAHSVKLHLHGQKLPLIFSIANEERLVGEWNTRRA